MLGPAPHALWRSGARPTRSGDGALRWLDAPEGVLSFARDPGFGCLVNLSARPVPLPEHAAVLLASGPLTGDGLLPADTAVWLST